MQTCKKTMNLDFFPKLYPFTAALPMPSNRVCTCLSIDTNWLIFPSRTQGYCNITKKQLKGPLMINISFLGHCMEFASIREPVLCQRLFRIRCWTSITGLGGWGRC